MLHSNAWRVVACSSLLSPALAQSVLVVDDDGGPGVAFTEVYQAVSAASPGDVLLVKSGDYASVLIDRPLSLVADAGADVLIERINVNAGVDSDLLLSGLKVRTLFVTALDMNGVTGSVRIQDCELSGGIGVGGVGAGHGAFVLNCTAVTFEGCTLTGGTDPVGEPASGAVFIGSTVFLFGSQVRGNDGQPGMPILQRPQDGAVGLSAWSSLVFCQGSSVSGGAGGDSGPFCAGADGGDGVVLNAAELQLLDSEVAGGPGGSSQAACKPGAMGTPVLLGTGTLVQHPGTAHGFAVQAVLREREPAVFAVQGSPGDAVFLAFGLGQANRFLPGIATPSLIPPPPAHRIRFLGRIPAGGTLAFPLTVGDLSPGLSALQLHAQVALRSPQGLALTNGRSTTLLDAGF